jgi:bacteriorhodopsin
MLDASPTGLTTVTLTGNEYLLVYNVFSLVVAAMFAAFIYFLFNINQVDKRYRSAPLISAVVVGIADGQFNEGYRYADWLLTVPLLIIELLVVLGLAADKRRPLAIRLVVAAILMIGLGYPGEVSTSDSTKWIFWVLSMIPFLYILATLVQQLGAAQKRESTAVAKTLRLATFILVGTWFVYPIAYLFPVIFGTDSSMAETVRQVGYSVADLLAKPVYGLVILAVAKLRTAELPNSSTSNS